MRRRWYAVALIAVFGTIGIWSATSPGNAIVEARVTLTAPLGNGFLSQVMTTQAFQTSDGGWILELWSKCALSINQIVDVRVPVSGLIFGGHPTSYEASLYKEGGVGNFGFEPWDGC